MLVGLLVASLVLVALLAREAVEASRSHRAVAENLLLDYAQLAADEMVRRSTSEVGYQGYYPLLTALQQELAAGEGHLPERALLAQRSPRVARALALARALFVSRPGGVELESGGDEAIRAEAVGLPPPGEGLPYAVHHGRLGTIAYAALGENRGIVGFEVDRQALRAWFRSAFERGPLLPPSLVDAGSGDLVVRVTDGDGEELFRAGVAEMDPVLSVHQPFGDAYSGIFEGMTVHVSIDPPAASRLVIGGLPRSRLPLLIVLILVTSGLLSLAILQLRRGHALERLRSNFVSEVSHELRTPLTQIRMFAETLVLGRIRSPEEGRRSLEIIDAEARRLGHLVENILQFSRGERGRIELAPQVRELAPVIREVARAFAPIADQRGVRLSVEPLDPGARASVDEEAMRQILLNLFDNAVKYGPRDQEVRVGLERHGDQVRLWVDDEGPGVPDSDRRRIWRSFERLDRDRLSAIAGTGIGLAVVRQLVELQGGSVGVETGSRGGARFVVALPAAEVAP
jgi:signal transduction histidine kinase